MVDTKNVSIIKVNDAFLNDILLLFNKKVKIIEFVTYTF